MHSHLSGATDPRICGRGITGFLFSIVVRIGKLDLGWETASFATQVVLAE
jgi:hypothetical protein